MLSQQVLDELDPADIPDKLKRTAAVIGLNAALTLAEALPGMILRMPKNGRIDIAKHFIERHMDEMTNEELSTHLGVSTGFVEHIRVGLERQRGIAMGREERHAYNVMGRIVAAVSVEYGVSLEDLGSNQREERISWPRQVAMFLIRRCVPTLSLERIGETFGGRHHTTVIHAIQVVQDRMYTDARHREAIERLMISITAGDQPPTPASDQLPTNGQRTD